MKKKQREKFTVLVESLDQEGRGVSRREGKVVFIQGALAGEQVQYERIRNKPSYEIGVVTDIYQASPLRVDPPCPYFGFEAGCCGGCAMQHLESNAQVAAKQQTLIDDLWHIGRIKPQVVLPPIYGPSLGYRHRARLSVKDVPAKGNVLVGFREKQSSFVADMQSCKILPERVSNLLVPLRELVASLSVRKELPQIELAVTEDCVALVLRILQPITPEDEIKLRDFQKAHSVVFWIQYKGPDSIFPLDKENFDKLKLRHPDFGVSITFKPTDFTQVNHQLNQAMVQRAVRLLGLSKETKVVDFFCGLGNFSLPIATQAARVIGVEGSPELVQRAERAAIENGLENKTRFFAKNLFEWQHEDWLSLWNEMGEIDCVLIDPPREGAMSLCQYLATTKLRPKKIVYVSCNPATLARDGGLLANQGGWVLTQAGVMNMFPHTAHVESIAVFENPADWTNLTMSEDSRVSKESQAN